MLVLCANISVELVNFTVSLFLLLLVLCANIPIELVNFTVSLFLLLLVGKET